MTIRRNDTEGFHTHASNWYMVVWVEDGKIQDMDLTGAKKNKKKIIELIDEWQKKKTPFRIYGVWHGEWSTDTFDLDPDILKKKFQEDLGIREKKQKTIA